MRASAIPPSQCIAKDVRFPRSPAQLAPQPLSITSPEAGPEATMPLRKTTTQNKEIIKCTSEEMVTGEKVLGQKALLVYRNDLCCLNAGIGFSGGKSEPSLSFVPMGGVLLVACRQKEGAGIASPRGRKLRSSTLQKTEVPDMPFELSRRSLPMPPWPSAGEARSHRRIRPRPRTVRAK